MRRGKAILFGGTIILLVAYSAVGYTAGSVPFPWERPVDITSSDVCASLGDQDKAVAALNKVLPKKAHYVSADDVDASRSRGDSTWRAFCVIEGGEESLLYGVTEMAAYGPAEGWIDDRLSEYTDDGESVYEFEAGTAAVATESAANILMPCIGPGEAPGGDSQLSVDVHTNRKLEGTPEENRAALAQLALGTAKYTYEKANCTEPGKLPDKVTGMSKSS